jgi:hypothetical protein
MKNILISIFALLALAQTFCHKSPLADGTEKPIIRDTIPTTPVVVFKDSLSMFYNSKSWIPVAQGLFHKPEGFPRFMIQGRKKVSWSVEEYFSVTDIPFATGKYQIEYPVKVQQIKNTIPQTLFVYKIDQDQIAATFQTDTTRAGQYIHIMSLDSVTRIVEGRFYIFLRQTSYVEGVTTAFPDTIAATQGYFKIKLKEQQ